MRHIFRGLPASSQKVDCALAIGNFDGVHLGHQKLLRTVCEAAREKALASAVLTFEPHPREFFGSENVVRINTLRDKIEAIRACGIETEEYQNKQSSCGIKIVPQVLGGFNKGRFQYYGGIVLCGY